VGLAGISTNSERFAGRTVATVLCGGNLAGPQIAAWLG
jgi:hypothetical protein